MNDRYLYRAKRTDNGEWVEGCLISDKLDDNILFIGNSYGLDMCDDPEYFDLIMVKPYTICQCTGLKDKNGHMIWENDILCAQLDDNYPDDITYASVLWRINGWHIKENGSCDTHIIEEIDGEYFKVCGNIFDNPELLEVAE